MNLLSQLQPRSENRMLSYSCISSKLTISTYELGEGKVSRLTTKYFISFIIILWLLAIFVFVHFNNNYLESKTYISEQLLIPT